jgi:hypothetical protein
VCVSVVQQRRLIGLTQLVTHFIFDPDIHITGITDESPHDYNATTDGSSLAAGTHEIRIFKATEADWNGGSPVPNYVTFHGINVESESGATAVPTANALAVLAPPPPLPTRKIEFLGDSITAG